MYLGNSGQLSFHSEKSLEELIGALRKFIKELTECFTAPKMEAWNPTLQRFVFSRRMRKDSEETNRLKNLALWRKQTGVSTLTDLLVGTNQGRKKMP